MWEHGELKAYKNSRVCHSVARQPVLSGGLRTCPENTGCYTEKTCTSDCYNEKTCTSDCYNEKTRTSDCYNKKLYFRLFQ